MRYRKFTSKRKCREQHHILPALYVLLLVLQGQVTQYDSLTQIKKEKCSLSNLMNVGFQYRIYHHIRKYLVHRHGYSWKKWVGDPIRYIHIIHTYENIINRLNADYFKLQ